MCVLKTQKKQSDPITHKSNSTKIHKTKTETCVGGRVYCGGHRGKRKGKMTVRCKKNLTV